MNTKHTPGPWSINEWTQSNSDIAIGAVGTPLIAKVALRDVSINEQKANARLIAAAPELLNALADLVELAEVALHAANSDGCEFNVTEELREARAAIAKAGGAA